MIKDRMISQNLINSVWCTVYLSIITLKNKTCVIQIPEMALGLYLQIAI